MSIDLISKANSWVTVWNRWKDIPSFVAFCDKLHEDQVFDCANLLNSWFAEQLEYIARLELDVEEWQREVCELREQLD
jgi:hypothetical protein